MSNLSKAQTVRVTTEMARGETLPTLTKTKGLRALLMLVEARGEIKPGEIYEMPLETFRDAMRCHDDTLLKAEMEGLPDLKINWAKYFPDLEGYTRPMPTCILDTKKRMMTFTLDSYFLKRWLDNSLGFRRINWEVLVAFGSLYAAKIYEYCAISFEPKRTVSTRRISLAELRELLGVPVTAYSHSAGPFFREIKKAVNSVNEAQDGFRVSYCSEGRGKSSQHWFSVEPASQQGRLKISAPPVHVVGGTLRGRIEAALDQLTAQRRGEVMEEMIKEGFQTIPEEHDTSNLRIYAGRLKNYDVEILPA